jgi:hypothetical protein
MPACMTSSRATTTPSSSSHPSGFGYEHSEPVHTAPRSSSPALCRFEQKVIAPGSVNEVQDANKHPCRCCTFLINRIKQQLFGHEIVRPGDDDRAQFDDRFVIPAGPKKRANGVVGLLRGMLAFHDTPAARGITAAH